MDNIPSNLKFKKRLILIILVLLAAAIYVYPRMADIVIRNMEQRQSLELERELQKLLLEQGTEFQLPQTDTSDWNTYEAEGFSFKYPKDWIVTDKSQGKDYKLSPKSERYYAKLWTQLRIKGKVNNTEYLCVGRRDADPGSYGEACFVIIDKVYSNWRRHDPWHSLIEYYLEAANKKNGRARYVRIDDRLLYASVEFIRSSGDGERKMVPSVDIQTFNPRNIFRIYRSLDDTDQQQQEIYLTLLRSISIH